jgi:hypothetical protein
MIIHNEQDKALMAICDQKVVSTQPLVVIKYCILQLRIFLFVAVVVL